MSTIKISFKIPCPTFIESIIVYFLLRYRKKHYGVAFMRIKLIGGQSAEAKLVETRTSAGRKSVETNSAERGLVETKLTAGGFAIVDASDYQKLAEYPWQLFETESSKCYAVQYSGRKIVYMHRQIMNAPRGKIVDHRDRNGLNNTRQNLRFATHSQNNCNRRRKTETKTSKYKGITLVPKTKKWQAYIGYNGTTKYLGCFDNEEDAARAYDEAAKELHGEFAVLNFSEENAEMKKILISNI